MTNFHQASRPFMGAERHAGDQTNRDRLSGQEERVIDMATSDVLRKNRNTRRRGEPIRRLGVDGEGHATTNSGHMVNGGALLTVGSDRERGGKGYPRHHVDILCGVLSGANWGPFTAFALRQEIQA